MGKSHLNSETESKVQEKLNLLKNTENPRHLIKSFCFAVTRECPFECRRCFFCGSKDRESIDIASAREIIGILPNDLEAITLSGGEPFANIELLFDVLREISNRDFSELHQICILTTGFWAVSRDYVKRVVERSLDLGVNMFAIGAFDRWHYEAGLERELPERLVAVLKEDFGAIEPHSESNEDILRQLYSHSLYVRPMANELAVPVVRGMWALKDDEKGMFPSKLSTSLFMCRDFLNTSCGYAYYVNLNGELHFCANFSAMPLGNLRDETFDSILRSAKDNQLLQMIHRGDMVAFAERYFGLSMEETERGLKNRSKCGLCTRLFVEYFKDREDKPIMHMVYEIERRKWDNSQR